MAEEGSLLSTAGNLDFKSTATLVYLNWTQTGITAGTTTASGKVYIIYSKID